MTQPTEQDTREASEIAQALDEPLVDLVNRVVLTLGIEQSRDFLQQALEIEANGGMTTKNGKRRRTPGGVFFLLVKNHVKATDKKKLRLIFDDPNKQRSATTDEGQPEKPAPAVDPLLWDDALKYANALLKHEKGEVRTVEVKLIGRPKNVAKAQSCMVVMMAGRSAPQGLPKGLPTPPEQVQNFAVFISNKHWKKVSEEMKATPNAELLVRGHPVFNPQKAMTMLLAQAVEVIVRKPKNAKEAA